MQNYAISAEWYKLCRFLRGQIHLEAEHLHDIREFFWTGKKIGTFFKLEY